MIGATRIVGLAGAAETALRECRPRVMVEDILAQLAVALADLRDEAAPLLEKLARLRDDSSGVSCPTNINSADVAELCELLDTQNLAALDRFCSMSPPLRAAVGALRFERIHEAIDKLNFQLAAELLREFLPGAMA